MGCREPQKVFLRHRDQTLGPELWIERFAEVIEEEGEASRMVTQSGQAKAQLKQDESYMVWLGNAWI